MILFCLPYAGGSAQIFYEWKKYLHPSIHLFPVELKGRGKRFNEIFYETLDEAVEDIFNILSSEIKDRDYAVLGHSMGSLLTYELYYKIYERGLKEPKHLFFSGYQAPNIRKNEKYTYNLPDHDFIRNLIDLGGTPEEVIKNKELLEIFLPILRNDFKIVEKYSYKERENKIECDITVLNGKEDEMDYEDVIEWKSHSCKKFEIYNFEGNHFFINDKFKEIIEIINKNLIKYKYQ